MRDGDDHSWQERAIILASFAWVGLSYLIFFLSWDRIAALAREDGFLENLGAIACFVGAAFFFVTYWVSPDGNRLFSRTTKRNIFFLLLAIGLFVLGAEEISWGQRIFGVHTPDVLGQANVQDETNLHNLEFFEGGGIFKKSFNLAMLAAVFVYVVVGPLLKRYSARFAAFIGRVNLPLPPLAFTWLALLMLVPLEIIKRLADLRWQTYVGEIRESDIEIMFMMLGIWFFAVAKRQREPDLPSPS